VLASAVARHTREIGIRMALGADGVRVRRRFLGQAGALVLPGTGLGLLGAWALSRVLGFLLFGVEGTDPVTYAVVPLILLLVAGVAVSVPVRRAVRVDPLSAIRYE
jgi:ABC-type antimicrobial peptide transport system permease subunit